MGNCSNRLALAGRTVSCVLTIEEHTEQTKGCYQCCSGCNPIYHIDTQEEEGLLWYDDTPCSYYAIACGTCNGTGRVSAQSALQPSWTNGCRRCNATGYIDPPDLPYGIGTLLKHETVHATALVVGIDKERTENPYVIDSSVVEPLRAMGHGGIEPGGWYIKHRVWPKGEKL